MSICLLLSVHLHDDCWHGAGEWPPSPGRLFQAVVAGVGLRGTLEDHQEPLVWLERLDAPVIAAPLSTETHGFTNFVPNNDLDAFGGDPRRISKVRIGKSVKPRLFERGSMLLYAWHFELGEEADRHAAIVRGIAESLYQFGRGVDMAYAAAEIISGDEAAARLASHPGPVWRPAGEDAAGGAHLRCPMPGTLQSLMDRHADQRIVDGLFRKPREARFRLVAYNCPPERLLFDLKPADQDRTFQPWPLTRVAELATAVRDGAARRLTEGMPELASSINRSLIGRGATERDKPQRVRIVPLPSIGHTQTDPSIRRVLVERPPDCPLRTDDLAWAFSGLDLRIDAETGEILPEDRPVLAFADDPAMLQRYIAPGDEGARLWRTITPAALPVARARRRIGGAERLTDEAEAAYAVRQALRHAGIAAPAEHTRVQREPFSGKGSRAEAFTAGSRFPAARLWHVEIGFAERLRGPLVIGDGRFCGLGIMMPVETRRRDALILPIRAHERPAVAHRGALLAALRRALMSLAADAEGFVATLFSGHANGTGPARSGRHRHVYLFADDADGDGLFDRLGVVAPWRVDRSWHPGAQLREHFEHVTEGLTVLRAGAAGLLVLDAPRDPDPNDPLFASARSWRSRTPYQVTARSLSGEPASAAVERDVLAECARRGLPIPDVVVAPAEQGSGRGNAEIVLHFSAAVPGPILLGRDAHAGGGLFEALCDNARP